MKKSKPQVPGWTDRYWADWVHTEGGMQAVVEGFANLEEACEFVARAKAAGIKYRHR